MNIQGKKKIIFSGGGTGGSVSPLLAMAGSLKKEKSFEFLFVGTKDGIEKEIVASSGLRYKQIHAGKFRRYFAWRNFFDLMAILVGFFESLALLIDEKPDLIISAGSFVSVPLSWAGCFFNIPILVHQQDIRPGLANRLMAPFAKVVTVTFERSLRDYKKKAVWTGNPVLISDNKHPISKQEVKNKLNLKNNLPLILVIGGGTGAKAINDLIKDSAGELIKFCQVIHLTGKGKNPKINLPAGGENYQAFDFLDHDRILEIMAVSDLVITRAGIGVLSELSAFSRPAIIIPLPDSHQEDNARYFAERNAALVLNQKTLNSDSLSAVVKSLLDNPTERAMLGENMGKLFKKGANTEIVNIVLKILGS